MATEYLNEGAVTMAAAGWSGSGIADSNDFKIEKKFGPITAGLDHSSLTTGIESMEFTVGASGIVGGGSAGPLILDADASADAFVRNNGKVTLYLDAGGGSGVINYFDAGAFSRNFLQGSGTFGTIYSRGGSIDVNESTVITNAKLMGGSGTLNYNSTKLTAITVSGGSWIIKRACTLLTVKGGTVIYDPDDAASHTSTALVMDGGEIDWRAGDIPTVTGNAGLINWANARTSITPGATSFTVSGTQFVDNSAVDTSNIVYDPGLGRTLESGIPL